MLTLLVVKENLKVFYSKYSTILNISIKFVLALICLLIINYNMAYLEAAKKIYLIIIMAIFCSVLPYGAIATILSVYILANIYKVSLEMTLIVAVFLLITAILYYSFSPKDAFNSYSCFIYFKDSLCTSVYTGAWRKSYLYNTCWLRYIYVLFIHIYKAKLKQLTKQCLCRGDSKIYSNVKCDYRQ